MNRLIKSRERKRERERGDKTIKKGDTAYIHTTYIDKCTIVFL